MKKSIRIDCTPLLSQHTGIAKYLLGNIIQLDKNKDYHWQYDYAYRISEHLEHQPKPMTDDEKAKQNTFDFLLQLKEKLRAYPRFFTLLKRIYHRIKLITSKLIPRKDSDNQEETNYDLYWQPNYLIDPTIKAKKTIVTIHDFSFEDHPDWHPQDRLDVFNQKFRTHIAKADKIICDSNYVKQCVIERLGFDKQDVHVIYLGIEHNTFKTFSHDQLQPIKQQFSLPDNFILFVGSIEPRKNLLTLLKAYHRLPKKDKKQTQLVLVGFKGWDNREVMRQIETEKEHIKYLGYLGDDELAKVYNLATLFVYPSFYEGFGIPPLEAMACGCPVIVSDVTSLPEVCADAADYVKPDDIDDIKLKIEKLLHSKEKREHLRAKGLEHVKQFQWKKSAQQHLNVFKQLL